MMRVRSIARAFSRPALAACLLALVAVGCLPGTLDPTLLDAGGNTGGGSGGSSGGCDQIQDLFTNSCGSATCHGPGAALLDLESVGAAARVVGVDAATMAKSSTALCEGKGKLIDQGSTPATGILIRKVTLPTGDTNQCGAKMPSVGILNQTQRDCIIAWANAVAIQ